MLSEIDQKGKRSPHKNEFSYYVAYTLLVIESVKYCEPKIYKEAIFSKDSTKWLGAMNEEMDYLEKNQTLGACQTTKRLWATNGFKRNEGSPGVEDIKSKVCLVAKGYIHIEEVDYNNMFSPIIEYNFI